MHPRTKFFINKRFQSRFIMSFIFSVLIWAIATVAIYMLLLDKKLEALRYSSHFEVSSTADVLLPTTIGTHAVSLGVFAVLLAWTIRTILKKLSPPLYSIKKDLSRIASGDLTGTISLYPGEEFQELACELEKMRQGLRNNFSRIKEQQKILEQAIASCSQTENTHNVTYDRVQALQSAISSTQKTIHIFQLQ